VAAKTIRLGVVTAARRPVGALPIWSVRLAEQRAAQLNATEGVSFSDDRLTYSGRELGEPGSVNGAAESTGFTGVGYPPRHSSGGERDGRRLLRATQER
jgi:hypothetical protein